MAINRKTALREQIRDNAIKAGYDPDTGTKNKKVKAGIKPTVLTPKKGIPLKPSEIVKSQKKN